MNNTIYTNTQKVDIIFSYLFSDKKSFEEEKFWNKLSNHELSKIEEIDKEETFDFNILKTKVLCK